MCANDVTDSVALRSRPASVMFYAHSEQNILNVCRAVALFDVAFRQHCRQHIVTLCGLQFYCKFTFESAHCTHTVIFCVGFFHRGCIVCGTILRMKVTAKIVHCLWPNFTQPSRIQPSSRNSPTVFCYLTGGLKMQDQKMRKWNINRTIFYATVLYTIILA